MKKKISGISFDLANTLIYTTQPFPSYRDLSDLLANEGYDIYPQELEAARQYVFFIELT